MQQTSTKPLPYCFHSMLIGIEQLLEVIEKTGSINIATLGPEGTSSEFVANSFLEELHHTVKTNLLLCQSYEEAEKSVIQGIADFMLVANAYHEINKFYISKEIINVGVFPRATPLYGLATIKDKEMNNRKKLIIASHRAPAHLVTNWLSDETFDLIYTSSTSIAAKMVSESHADACITTDTARKKYNLCFISSTYKINMLWSIFARINHPSAHCFFKENNL